jgi:hypothetical protein
MFRETRVVAEFPATSETVPLMICPTPSVVTVCGGGQLTTPDKLSEQVKVTVTGVLFQPVAEASGDCVAVIVGGVKSKLTLTQAVAGSPAVSKALPQMD